MQDEELLELLSFGVVLEVDIGEGARIADRVAVDDRLNISGAGGRAEPEVGATARNLDQRSLSRMLGEMHAHRTGGVVEAAVGRGHDPVVDRLPVVRPREPVDRSAVDLRRVGSVRIGVDIAVRGPRQRHFLALSFDVSLRRLGVGPGGDHPRHRGRRDRRRERLRIRVLARGRVIGDKRPPVVGGLGGTHSDLSNQLRRPGDEGSENDDQHSTRHGVPPNSRVTARISPPSPYAGRAPRTSR